jgi:thioredoxin 1
VANFYLNKITDANFESVCVACDRPVLLHFWAAWCSPCRMLSPTIEALATEYKGRVMVGTVDTESNMDTAMRFAVWVLPTVLVLHRGNLVKRFQGTRGRLDYARQLNALLAPSRHNGHSLDQLSMRR